jgi:CRISPR-associated protein Csx10
MKLPTARIGSLVPVTLLSPLWLPDQENGETLIARALGANSYFLEARRFARDGAWDQRRGAMQSCWTIAAGAVFVVELSGQTWRDAVERLQALEREGVGERRYQGYGQVICFDPHIIDRAGKP